MMERIKNSAPRVIVISILFLLLTYIPLFLNSKVVEAFVNEDQIFETLTPIYFIITSVLLMIAFFRFRPTAETKKYFLLKRLALLGFAVLFFVAAGEEISWGQRIFNFATPEAIKEVNVQQEFTIHNLDFFQGDTASLDFSQLQTLFSLGFAFLIPVAAFGSRRLFKFDLDAILPVVPLSFSILVVLNYVIQKILRNIVEVVPGLFHDPSMPFTEALYEVREHGNAYAMMISVLFYVALTLYASSGEAKKPTVSN